MGSQLLCTITITPRTREALIERNSYQGYVEGEGRPCGYLSEAVHNYGSNAAVDIAAITFTDKFYFRFV